MKKEKKKKNREPIGFLEFKIILIKVKYFKTMIVEIKLFMKELNKRIVLVEDLLHQGNAPRMRSKKAKR